MAQSHATTQTPKSSSANETRRPIASNTSRKRHATTVRFAMTTPKLNASITPPKSPKIANPAKSDVATTPNQPKNASPTQTETTGIRRRALKTSFAQTIRVQRRAPMLAKKAQNSVLPKAFRKFAKKHNLAAPFGKTKPLAARQKAASTALVNTTVATIANHGLSSSYPTHKITHATAR